jgi:hypothetical protein
LALIETEEIAVIDEEIDKIKATLASLLKDEEKLRVRVQELETRKREKHNAWIIENVNTLLSLVPAHVGLHCRLDNPYDQIYTCPRCALLWIQDSKYMYDDMKVEFTMEVGRLR